MPSAGGLIAPEAKLLNALAGVDRSSLFRALESDETCG